jgi:rare lipoprotein A
MLARVRRDAIVIAASIALCIFISACSKRRHTPRVPTPPAVGAVETGIASWYGHPYHGRRAANGEVYDMEQMTAAHRTLPFGTRLRVTNQANSKSVEVRINDRGPFVGGRIIDLSRAAAVQIEMIGPGTAKVRVVVLGYGPAAGETGYAVQVGAFREKSRAEAMKAELEKQYAPVRIVRRDGDQASWRVLVGNRATQEEAEAMTPGLKRWSADAFVVKLDP